MDFLIQLGLMFRCCKIRKRDRGIDWSDNFFKLRLLYVVTGLEHYLHLFGFVKYEPLPAWRCSILGSTYDVL